MRSSSSLQTGAPIPGQTVAVFACPQRPVFSFQARRSRGQSALWGADRQPADVTGLQAHGREARTGWAMTGPPPAQPGPPTLR